mgnify:FL=1
MNILFISYIYPRKSNMRRGMFVHQRVKYIMRKGNNVEVITTKGREDPDFEVMDGIKIHRVSAADSIFSGILFIKNALKKIIDIGRTENIDFILQEFVGISTVFIGLLAKIKRKRFVLITQATKWELQFNNPVNRLFIKLAFALPEKIICCSNGAKHIISNVCNPRKMYVVNNGLDDEQLVPAKTSAKFREELGIKKGQIMILTVSNLMPKKGIDVILQAIPNVIKKHGNLKYFIVGEGNTEADREKLEELAGRLGIREYVRFEGKKIMSDLANYYNACDIFVVMSRDIGGEVESFGIVYIEASFFGKPVIGGISGGTADAVENGKTGYLIDSGDSKKIEETILALIHDRKLREKLGKAGKKRVLNGFLWKQSAEKLLKILNMN